MKWTLSVFLVVGLYGSLSCQRTSSNLIKDLLRRSQSPVVNQVLSSPDTFQYQIIYEEIVRDKKGNPHFKKHTLNVDPKVYFYPASTIKMANAVVALEKLDDLGLSPWLTFHTDSSRYPQQRVTMDTSAKDNLPTIGHYIDMVFVVSDNQASNRLYEFIGQAELNQRLTKKGYKRTRILQRLADFRFSPEDNRFTNPVYLLEKKDTVYIQGERYGSAKPIAGLKMTKQGIGYFDTRDSLIQGPFDFSKKNFFPLEDQMNMIKAIMFPEVTPLKNRFDLTVDSYKLLHTAMSRFPRESIQPQFDTTEFYDSYCKFFIYGDSKERIPDHIRIYNKVGWAYGFLTDAAYIVDTKNNVEFLLAGTVLVNRDQIFNDDQYEFETIGKPFLAEVGRVIYEYELRKK